MSFALAPWRSSLVLRALAWLGRRIARLVLPRSSLDYASAVRFLSTPGALNHPDERLLLRLRDLFAERGDQPRAIAISWALAERCTATGHHTKAAALYRRVLELAPLDLDAHLAIARTYEALERRREAASQYEVLGRLLESTAPAEAHAAFARAVALDPSIETAWSGKMSLELRYPQLAPPPAAVVPAQDGSEDLSFLWSELPDPAATVRYESEQIEELLSGEAEVLSYPHDDPEPSVELARRRAMMKPVMETPSGTIYLDLV